MRRERRAHTEALPTRPTRGHVWLGPAPPVGSPHTNALLAQVLAEVFTEVHLSASIMDGITWYAIHSVPNVATFEMSHGVETRRWPYNERCFQRARRDRVPVLGEHAGFFDSFAAVGGGPWALVTGPFAVARPTSSDIRARWHAMTGSHGHPSDPEFLHYLSMTLGTTTLEGGALEIFQRVVKCLADFLYEPAETERLTEEVERLREKLYDVRFAERMWDATRNIIDERTFRAWLSPAKARDLKLMGASSLPQHVLVGLLLGRDREADPVDDLLRRDAFQRACVDSARRRRGVLCGRIGSHGVVLLADPPGSGARLRADLHEIGERATALAKRFDLRLHLGVNAEDDPTPLPDRYQSAMSAAEEALSRGRSWAYPSRGPRRSRNPLSVQRRLVAEAVGENPSLLSPRFDRYLEVLEVHCGHRLEPIRAHLEAGFDQITDALRATGMLEEKSLDELRRGVERAAADSNTVREIAAAYRAGIADIELSLLRPQHARSDRSIRRVIAFVRDHLAEPLSVGKVARIAGFAPRYFSKLFVENEKKTFHQYVVELRLERARHMLLSTTLSAEKVGQLAGFATRSHFHRAFKQAEGTAPQEYRKRSR